MEESEEVKLEYVDEVVRESVPLEGEMEDSDVPEESWASVNTIPTKNDTRQNPTPPISEEDTEGVLLPVPPVAEDVQRTCKDADAITTPHMQTAAEKAEEDEDQAMALWLSDPEDDEDQATAMVTNEASIQIGNALVEGERKDSDERVDNEGNQPIPQPATKPEPDWPNHDAS